MNAYFKLAGFAALALAGASAGYYVAADRYGAQLAEQQRDTAQYKLQLADESQRVKDARQAAADEAQRFWQAKFAAHDADLLREKNEEIAARDRTNAALRSGARSMYVDATCPTSGGGNGVSATAAGSGLGDGTTRVRLSATYGEFFESIGAEADELADQLRAAQKILQDERAAPTTGASVPAT